MKYLIFKKKTKTTDGNFVGVIDAENFAASKKIVSKIMGENHHSVAATAADISWYKNDAKVRLDKTNSLPADFDINTAKKLN